MNKTALIIGANGQDGQFRKPSDNSKIKNYLPDYKFTSFEVGIKETINWFEDNYPNIKA